MFLYHQWLQLPITTRIRIASDFGIEKKGSTHVQDNVVQSDGYLVKDVEQALNVDALQKKLNTKVTDMAVLWEMLINPPVVLDVPVINNEKPHAKTKAKKTSKK